MENFDEFEFFKELYVQENSRKNDVQTHLNIPLAIITALITSGYFLLSNFNFKTSVFLNIPLIIISLILVIVVIISIFYITKALGVITNRFEYKVLTLPSDLKDWKDEIDNHYNNTEEADRHFKKEVLKMMIECGTHNMEVNDEKFEQIHKSKGFLVYGLIALFLMTILFVIGSFMNYNKPPDAGNNTQTKVSTNKSTINSNNKNHVKQYTKSDSKSNTKSDSSSTIKSTASPKSEDNKRGRKPEKTQINASN